MVLRYRNMLSTPYTTRSWRGLVFHGLKSKVWGHIIWSLELEIKRKLNNKSSLFISQMIQFGVRPTPPSEVDCSIAYGARASWSRYDLPLSEIVFLFLLYSVRETAFERTSVHLSFSAPLNCEGLSSWCSSFIRIVFSLWSLRSRSWQEDLWLGFDIYR